MAVLHLVTGKDGCGKSTCASMAAVRAAMHGKRTLLISLDPVKSMDYIFQMNIGRKLKRISKELTVTGIDLDQKRPGIGSRISKKHDLMAVSEYLDETPDERSMKILSIIQEAVSSSSYDEIYFDGPAFFDFIQTITLPLNSIRNLNRLLQADVSAGKTGKIKKVEAMLCRFEELFDILINPALTEITMVVNPDLNDLENSLFVRNSLARSGFQVSRVFINRSTPDDASVDKVADIFEEAVVEVLHTYGRPIQGMNMLVKFSQQFYNYLRPAAANAVTASFSEAR